MNVLNNFGNYIEQHEQNFDCKTLFKIAYDIHRYCIQYHFQYCRISFVIFNNILFITLLKIVCNFVYN